MATRYGGPLPDTKYGLELTVEPPATVTEAAPITAGEILRITGTAADSSGYKVADPAAAAVFDAATLLCQAKHTITDPNAPLGVKVFGMGAPTVVRMKYTGTAPTVGQSVVTHGTAVRTVTGAAAGPLTRVMQVFTGTTEVEVLVG